MLSRSKLPIGISDFRTIIESDRYFVDKSLLIKEVMDDPNQVILLPRPRRFGKTLNLSMLRYFYEKTDEPNDRLFRELAVWREGEQYRSACGRHPVVFLTLKDVKTRNWEDCLETLKQLIAEEYLRHDYLLSGDTLKEVERRKYDDILTRKAPEADYQASLKSLLTHLENHHQQRAVLLIDEYDTPIHAGYVYGFYDDVVGFMRNWLSGGLKDHASLEKGILTGILRVARESIFSGLNNLEVYGLLSRCPFADKFGFTEPEVARLLEDFGSAEHLTSVQEWYDGYDFGGTTIYNPWSILRFAASHVPECEPHWVNTSSNDLVYELIQEGGDSLKEDLEALVSGASLSRQVNENIVFRDIRQSEDAVWSFLLFSGYLKASSPRKLGSRTLYDLAIPNREVASLYEQIINSWLTRHLPTRKLDALYDSLLSGRVPQFRSLLQDLVLSMLSYHDVGKGETRTPEAVYQAFVLGLLADLGHAYIIRSNREAGMGRADILMAPRDTSLRGVVMELKSWEEGHSAEEQLEAALAQIEEKQYAAELAAQGIEEVLRLGIVFDGKQLHVREG